MPTVIIIAGPNGAGKTTFAKQFLSDAARRDLTFVNADEIARRFADEPDQDLRDLRAGRIMLDRIEELAASGADFALETTLASLTYARKIPIWRQRGYRVSLVYVRLGSVDESLARVSKRVEAGGHRIREDAIRRRFGRSWTCLETIYKPIVDDWYIWESRDGEFVLTEASERS